MSASGATYDSELARAMQMLAEHPKTLFVGQGVLWESHRMFRSLDGVAEEWRIEMPVAEDFQMGFCIGLALAGYIPVCIYPRIDFMLLAANQLVNHLDKLHLFGWAPKVIIRTAVGATEPLDPGPQHSQDHGEAFKEMLSHVDVIRLNPSVIFAEYQLALDSERPSILIEYMENYG